MYMVLPIPWRKLQLTPAGMQVPKEEVMEVPLWDADPLGSHHANPKP